MNLSKKIPFPVILAGVVMSALLILACGSDPTPTPLPTATPQPTATPVPTPTPTPEPTATPTRLPPTPTAAPTSPAPPPTAQMRGLSVNTPGPEERSPLFGLRPYGSLIPEGASLIVEVYPGVVLDSGTPFIDLVLGSEDESPGDAISSFVDEFQDGTGIDLFSVDYVDYAELFMDVNALLGLDLDAGVGELTFGLALYGDINEAEIVASFDRDEDTEYELSDYRGFNVYELKGAGDDPNTIGIVKCRCHSIRKHRQRRSDAGRGRSSGSCAVR